MAQPASETLTLWRPVGPAELALIEAAEFRAFPSRLPEQPIFRSRVRWSEWPPRDSLTPVTPGDSASPPSSKRPHRWPRLFAALRPG